MRSVLLAVALATLAAAPAYAGRILFATEASQNAVDGFCIRGDGSLEPTPKVRIEAAGSLPRRLVVKADPATGTDGVLYVVESDRVQAFRIGREGGLAANGSIAEDPSMDPLDVAVSDDGQTVYVPHNGRRRIAAYTLDTEGRLPKDFSRCLNGPFGPGYQRLLVRKGLLYVTATILGGRLQVFPAATADDPWKSPDACRVEVRERGDLSCPLAERRKLLTPGPFVISDDDVVYVESLANRRILGFQLTDGLFESPTIKKTGEPIDAPTLCALEQTDATIPTIKWQKPLVKTAIFQQYHDVTLLAPKGVIYGSQFTHGRLDAYRIKENRKLPKYPNRRTVEDARWTPVGLAVSPDGRTLYVGAGELDRVRAYRLGAKKGLPEDPIAFSETEERKGSFPNAVAVAELSGPCR